MVDVLTALVAGAAGIGLGGVVAYFVFNSRPRQEKVVVPVRSAPRTPVLETVSSTDLERSKREMRTIMVERDLLSSALMKVYEAETDGRITRDERETISKRYSEQIKDLQSKLKDVELLVEVGELEGLRNELVTLFEGKIQNIEGRLEAARQRLGAAAPVPVKKEAAPKAEKPQDLEKVIEKRRPEMSEGEKRRKEIMDDVMGELARLEQLDIEKKQQEN